MRNHAVKERLVYSSVSLRERLQQQIDTQRSDQITAQAALQENFELRAALNLESLAAFERKTCSVIGSSPTNFAQRVEIDCGSLDSLRVGMPVVNDAGLVGKITTVSPEVSTVMLVTDPLYHVPVKVIAEVDPTPSTTAPVTVPSGLPVEDVTTTTSTTTTTTTLPSGDEAQQGDEGDEGDEGGDGSEQSGAAGSDDAASRCGPAARARARRWPWPPRSAGPP